jgi:predicted RecB family endonuclease
MFQDSVDKVEADLRHLVTEVNDLVAGSIHDLYASVEKNYLSCIEAVSEAQKQARQNVLEVVRGCKPGFADLFVERA